MALLENQTLKRVKGLCKSTCANFIDGNCIQTNTTCDYYTKYGKDISCDWFEECVLPNDKAIQKEYVEQHGIIYKETEIGKYSRTCKACQELFKTDSKNKLTCSDLCIQQLRKQTNSAYYLRQS
ncbi:cysteine-rich VLP protein [Bacillus sp. X1(2014)]|uniref:cysteine-rich VLP protein n=1 Tax=Bacillus sp. X1(2014) TaxID=1565991 RepID=UPI0011A5C81C|nr:cysteine-rich VLP protein [Bacillus sp. X1(2014)]